MFKLRVERPLPAVKASCELSPVKDYPAIGRKAVTQICGANFDVIRAESVFVRIRKSTLLAIESTHDPCSKQVYGPFCGKSIPEQNTTADIDALRY